MDLDVVQFFERMFDKDLFKNTIILVMGDHGHRFDGIRSTYIGRIEERMPFLGILLPETLQKSHPHLQVHSLIQKYFFNAIIWQYKQYLCC